MFLSAAYLIDQYGVDAVIAKHFVDREPPRDNLYWKDKLLYLRPQPGYMFLPLITDLYHRQGIEKDILLSETFLQLLENIGHYTAMHEFGMTTNAEAIAHCTRYVSSNFPEAIWLDEVIHYFNQQPNCITPLRLPYNALHRGDLFLFALCAFNIKQDVFEQLVKTWFALIGVLLLMDDAEDFETDRQQNDENAFTESGADKAGFEQIQFLLRKCLDHIKKNNSIMADGLHKSLSRVAEKPFIKALLNS